MNAKKQAIESLSARLEDRLKEIQWTLGKNICDMRRLVDAQTALKRERTEIGLLLRALRGRNGGNG